MRDAGIVEGLTRRLAFLRACSAKSYRVHDVAVCRARACSSLNLSGCIEEA